MNRIDTGYLQQIMEREGISGMKQLAARCQANRMSLYNILHYGREPSYRLMVQIIHGLNLSHEEIGHLLFGQLPRKEKAMKDPTNNVLSDAYERLTVVDLNTGEELAVVTDELITTAADHLVVKLLPRS